LGLSVLRPKCGSLTAAPFDHANHHNMVADALAVAEGSPYGVISCDGALVKSARVPSTI